MNIDTRLPLVSYIIPSYNHAAFITQAIESVLNQTYGNIELIVIDDFSTDNTREVLKKYENYHNVTIVYNEKNLKQSATVNKALKIAKGEFIGLLPSDDWIYPDKVKNQVARFMQLDEKVGVIYGKGLRAYPNNQGDGFEYFGSASAMYRGKITEKLFEKGNFIYPVTPLFRRECFIKFPFDESYTAEGEAIYYKISLIFEFDYVEEVVGVMRDHSDNTGKNTDLMLNENVRYTKDLFENYDIPDNLRHFKTKRLARIYKVKAMENIFIHKNFLKGRQLGFEALKQKITLIFEPKFTLALVFTFLPPAIPIYFIDHYFKIGKRY